MGSESAAEAVLRTATMADRDAIDALMKASTRAIVPAWYDAEQTESSARSIASVDTTLIADGTYFVIEEESDLVACGGWSRRDTLFSGEASQEGLARLLDPTSEPARVRAMFVRADRARRGLGTWILEACEAAARAEGFRSLALMATLTGVPLDERFGFSVRERVRIRMPDGVELECAAMDKTLT